MLSRSRAQIVIENKTAQVLGRNADIYLWINRARKLVETLDIMGRTKQYDIGNLDIGVLQHWLPTRRLHNCTQPITKIPPYSNEKTKVLARTLLSSLLLSLFFGNPIQFADTYSSVGRELG